jgi:hypothetical protein
VSCDVFLYDDQLAALTSGTFEVTETDHWGVKIDIQTAHPQSVSGGLGARLTSPTPPEAVTIYVDDLSANYAPRQPWRAARWLARTTEYLAVPPASARGWVR